MVNDPPSALISQTDDDTAFYGKKYWLEHQQSNFDYPDIFARTRSDLPERNLYWLKTLLKYRLPPSRTLELGCAHGSFVALLQQAGFEASGTEMSPWVVDFAKRTFDISVHAGPIEVLKLAPGSYDCILLFDVLEHLEHPLETVRHCLTLLKPDGVFVVQTPDFVEGIDYEDLCEARSPFLDQLKIDEHIHLFSRRAIGELFSRAGIAYLEFERAIFAHYDMFFVASRNPIRIQSRELIEASLLATSKGRMALAMLDIESDLNNRVTATEARLGLAEADREMRAKVIEQQGEQLSEVQRLVWLTEQNRDFWKAAAEQKDADLEGTKSILVDLQLERDRLAQDFATLERLRAQDAANLQASEADREMRAKVIDQQGEQLSEVQRLVWLTEQNRDFWKAAAEQKDADLRGSGFLVAALRSEVHQLEGNVSGIQRQLIESNGELEVLRLRCAQQEQRAEQLAVELLRVQLELDEKITVLDAIKKSPWYRMGRVLRAL